jgi:hypothetical protein
MYVMRQWQDWVDEQERLHNYPDFGVNCGDYRLENNSNMPVRDMAQTEGQICKYQFLCTLYYMEDKER